MGARRSIMAVIPWEQRSNYNENEHGAAYSACAHALCDQQSRSCSIRWMKRPALTHEGVVHCEHSIPWRPLHPQLPHVLSVARSFRRAQLWTNYGDVAEVWFDGGCAALLFRLCFLF